MNAKTGERDQRNEGSPSEVAVSEVREVVGAERRHAIQAATQAPVKEQKEKLEVEKLREELQALTESRAEGRTWRPTVRALIAGGLTSLVTGGVGYLFGDSLEARSRAEMRKSTMVAYFNVDNTIAGKRKQMLGYIETTLAVGDPELLAWVQQEKVVVDEQLEKAKKKEEGIETERAMLRARADAVEARLADTQTELVRAEGELGKSNKAKGRLQLERNFALAELERLKARIVVTDASHELAAAKAPPSDPAPAPAPGQ